MKCCDCSECLSELDQLVLESEELYDIVCCHIEMMDDCVDEDGMVHLMRVADAHVKNLENKYHNIILQIQKLVNKVK